MPPGFEFSDPRPPQRTITADWPAEARLWLVLDEAAAAPRTLPDVTRQAILGGVDAVLCRLKTQSPDRVYTLARELREICAEQGCPFVMSHHAALALHLGADGLQLGSGDISLPAARQMIGPEMKLGRSCHSVAEAAEAFSAGADYVFLGPIFSTPSKLAYGPPLGLDVVSTAAAQLPGPVVFIGGIGFDNIEALLAAGGERVAVIRAVQAADEIAGSCWSLRSRMKMARSD